MNATSPVPTDSPQLSALIVSVAHGLELAGIGVILIGVAIATVVYLTSSLRLRDLTPGYPVYRANLGRGILLGLELLVAADIIATVTAPLTFESVGLLGLIVLIRTFLSVSLETEIEGRWPWQRGERAQD